MTAVTRCYTCIGKLFCPPRKVASIRLCCVSLKRKHTMQRKGYAFEYLRRPPSPTHPFNQLTTWLIEIFTKVSRFFLLAQASIFDAFSSPVFPPTLIIMCCRPGFVSEQNKFFTLWTSSSGSFSKYNKIRVCFFVCLCVHIYGKAKSNSRIVSNAYRNSV